VLREENLRRREAALLEKEKELERKELEVGAAGGKKLNWPFGEGCSPILYHSIADDIPPEFHSLMRKFYAAVLFGWLCLLWNFICNLAIWFSDASSTGGSDCLYSAIYVVAGVPISWRTWYRGVYNGVRDRKTGNWLWFFIFFAAHIVFGVLMGVGVPSVAAAGLLVMFKMFTNKFSILGLLCLVDAIVWGSETLFAFYLIKDAHRVWKAFGGAAQLQKDVAKTVVEQQMNTMAEGDAKAAESA